MERRERLGQSFYFGGPGFGRESRFLRGAGRSRSCADCHYGQRAALREIEAARQIRAVLFGRAPSAFDGVAREARWEFSDGKCRETVPSISAPRLDNLVTTRETARAVWVPNRNGVLINAAAAFAERSGCSQVVVGFNREEAATFPDNSADFLEARRSRARAFHSEWCARRLVIPSDG